jgi:hypothetical protein
MGFADVLGDNVPSSLADLGLFTDYSNATTARAGCRLHDIHRFKVSHFSIQQPPFVVLWQYVSSWRNIICRAVYPPHSLDIAPH